MKKNKSEIFYVCGVAWQHEVAETSLNLCRSIAILKKECPCWKECGIVELTITGKWVSPQKLPGIKQKKDTGV